LQKNIHTLSFRENVFLICLFSTIFKHQNMTNFQLLHTKTSVPVPLHICSENRKNTENRRYCVHFGLWRIFNFTLFSTLFFSGSQKFPYSFSMLHKYYVNRSNRKKVMENSNLNHKNRQILYINRCR
jgi:hypothetical protein